MDRADDWVLDEALELTILALLSAQSGLLKDRITKYDLCEFSAIKVELQSLALRKGNTIQVRESKVGQGKVAVLKATGQEGRFGGISVADT